METRRRRKVRAASALVAVIAVLVVAFGWFEVHTLVIDDRVAETAPVASDVAWQGSFESLDHETLGSAVVLGAADERYVRLQDFRTSNGPDLRVYLIPAGADGIGDAIDLGPLKGNVGDQNYAVPPTADLAQYSRVLIWCVRFDSPFGAATLTPV